MKAKSSKDNLCDTCRKCIADCDAKDIEFGDGVGNDNIVECGEYEEEW